MNLENSKTNEPHKFVLNLSSIQFEGISTFCPLGYFWVGSLAHFRLQKSNKKNDKIHKDFELYQVFMYNLCGLIFPIHLLFTKRMEAFGLEISVIHGILEHIVLNTFSYIF